MTRARELGAGAIVAARGALAAIAGLALACASAPPQPPPAPPAAETPSPPYRVSVSRPQGGTIVSADGQIDCGTKGVGGSDACGQARYESSATFTAIPDAGYRFAGWAGDCSGSEPTCRVDTSRSRADKWVAAAFEPEAVYRGTYFRVTVARPQGGTVESEDGRIRCGTVTEACGPALFRWADVARLRAIPDAGHRFERWGGDCTGASRCVLKTATAPTDKTVEAVFEPR